MEENEEQWEVESLVARAKEMALVTETWSRFQTFMAEKAQQLGAIWVGSAEISTETYAAEGKVRFHLAAVLTRAIPMRFTSPWNAIEFEGAPAIYRPKLDMAQVLKAEKKLGHMGMFAEAAYYLQMPKIGQLLHGGDKRPYKDYKVNARWVTEYLQAGGWPKGDDRVRALGLAIFTVSRTCGEPWAAHLSVSSTDVGGC